MKAFNAIQITLLLAAGPILLNLLKGATFAFATPLFWVCAVVYAIIFLWTVFMIADTLDRD